MSMGLTFGSFGDLITAAQLVHRLLQSLSESRGSASELQSLVVELRSFQNVLQQLIFFWQSKRQCEELEQLASIARPTIGVCKDTIEAFLDKAVENYGRSLLRRKGSPRSFRDIFKAIQWNLTQKDDIEKLRAQLRRSMDILQMVQTQANRIIDDQDHTAVSDRITSIVDAEREADVKIDAHFANLLLTLEDGARTMGRIEGVSNAIFSAVSSLGSNVLAIRDTVLSIEQIVLMLPGMLSRLSLFSHNIVYLEDALGWTLNIYLDYHPSWETVHSILLDQSARYSSPGIEMVKARYYVLQDSKTGKDANHAQPFYQIARPGQKYTMSMLFHGDRNTEEDEKPGETQESKCPKCGHVNAVTDPDFDTTCQNIRCQLIYRRVVDVTNMDETRLQEWVKDNRNRQLELPEDEDERSQDRAKGNNRRQLRLRNMLNDSDEDARYRKDGTGENQTQDIEIIDQNGAHMSDTFLDGPEIFKRVRFLSTWESRMDSRGPLCAAAGDMRVWDTSSLSSGVMMDLEAQMHATIEVYLRPYEDWILAGEEGAELKTWACIWFIAFMGPTREQSVPVLMLIAESKRVRKRLLRVIKHLEWVGNRSQIALITGPVSAFPGIQAYSEGIWNREKTPGTTEFSYYREITKRRKMLTR